MNSTKITFLALLLIFLSSCASSYKAIEPQSFNFSNTELGDDVIVKYRYDVLRQRGNKKFAKDESANGLKIAAVEITNNNDFPVIFGDNLKLYNGESEIPLVSPLTAVRKIRQCSGCYLPYLLLTFTKLYINSGNTTTTYNIGYILGPLITGLNVFKASNANSKLKRILIDYDLNGIEIRPGETVSGLVTVASRDFPNLEPRVFR